MGNATFTRKIRCKTFDETDPWHTWQDNGDSKKGKQERQNGKTTSKTGQEWGLGALGEVADWDYGRKVLLQCQQTSRLRD